MLYIICYGVINMLIMSTINYYATYIMGSTGAATIIMAVYLIVAIVATILTVPLDKMLGRRNMMIFSAAIMIVGKIWFILAPYSTGAIYLNTITFAIGVTVAFVMFNTNRNNIADLVEWQSGRRIDSMVSTVDNLASKMAKRYFFIHLYHISRHKAAGTPPSRHSEKFPVISFVIPHFAGSR